jgi:NADPH:quinone reductase-like Zn-dependent oxidoreductase
MRAARLTGSGDAPILRLVDEPAREPGAGEVRIRVTSAGLNRADVLYPAGWY